MTIFSTLSLLLILFTCGNNSSTQYSNVQNELDSKDNQFLLLTKLTPKQISLAYCLEMNSNMDYIIANSRRLNDSLKLSKVNYDKNFEIQELFTLRIQHKLDSMKNYRAKIDRKLESLSKAKVVFTFSYILLIIALSILGILKFMNIHNTKSTSKL